MSLPLSHFVRRLSYCHHPPGERQRARRAIKFHPFIISVFFRGNFYSVVKPSSIHKRLFFYIFSFSRNFLFGCQAIFNPGGKSVRRVKIFAPTPRHISLKSRQRWYPDGFFWVSVIVGKSHRALEYIGSQNNQKYKGKIEKSKRKICLPDPSPRSPK